MAERTDRAVLVTGAAGGIGMATVAELTGRGYQVFAGVRSEAAPALTALGARVIPLDVTDPVSVDSAAETVRAALHDRGLAAVVNNAGVIVQGPLELVPDAELHRQFAVNVLGAACVVRAFLPLLRDGHGRIVNISAPTGQLAVPFAAPISASKAALDSLTAALRLELAEWRMPVISVVPGGTETEIFTKADAAAATTLEAADPAVVALYASRLEAVGRALADQKLSPPARVATTIARAVAAPRPRRRYLASRDARLFAVVARLPIGLRERLIARMLGLRS